MGRKKRRNRGVVLVLMLLALGGIFLLYRYLGQVTEPLGEGGNSAGAGVTDYTVSNRASADVRELRYTYDGKTLSFTYDGGKSGWKSVDEPNFPINKEHLDSMAAYISSLSATRKLEGDTGEYGFSVPVLAVNAVYADGASISYKIGSYNSFAGGYYLLTETGEVYIVDKGIVDCFRYSLEDMIQLDQHPVDFDENELVSVIVVSADETTKIVTDADDILELADASVGTISLTDWACAYATDAEKLSLYGISEESRTVTLVYRSYYSAAGEANASLTERSWTYCFGDTVSEEETDKIYFSLMQDGETLSGIVYQTDLSVYERILSVLAKAE